MHLYQASLFLSTHAGLLSLVMLVGACLAAWQRRVQDLGSEPPRRRPSRVGPYLLLERIGAGAMGEVHRARHMTSGLSFAVKLLAPGASLRHEQQFEQEACIGALLSHPNNVAALERGRSSDGRPYLVMPLVEGIDLEALLERDGPQPVPRVIEMLRQVALALEELHDLGLVHRDIKPSNILSSRGPDGKDTLELIDFGLVRRLGASDALAGDELVVGTPLYISPEAITEPQSVDGRSDIYGLGAVAYCLLSGAPPFRGRCVIEVCSQHLLRAPEPLQLESLAGPGGAALERLVLDCLAKDPDARPRDARQLLDRLELCSQLLTPRRPRRAPRRLESTEAPPSTTGYGRAAA